MAGCSNSSGYEKSIFSVWINGIGTMAGYIQIISISIWPTTLDETDTRL